MAPQLNSLISIKHKKNKQKILFRKRAKIISKSGKKSEFPRLNQRGFERMKDEDYIIASR